MLLRNVLGMMVLQMLLLLASTAAFSARICAAVDVCSSSPLSATLNVFTGFEQAMPAAPYDQWYNLYYRSLSAALPLTTFARVWPSKDNLTADGMELLGHATASKGAKTHILFPLSHSVAREMTSWCVAGNATGAAYSLEEYLSPVVQMQATNVGLVLSNITDNSGEGSATVYNVSCVIETLHLAHTEKTSTARNFGGGVDAMSNWSLLQRVSAVLFRDADASVGSRAANPSQDQSNSLEVPKEAMQMHPFALVLFRTVEIAMENESSTMKRTEELDAAQWAAVRDNARFNYHRVWQGLFDPLHAVQTRFSMYLGVDSTSEQESEQEESTGNHACFYNDTMQCAPIGSFTVWASSGNTAWRWDGAEFEKRSKPGSVALFVSSSSIATVHDGVPGADSAASGIVAGLAATDALKRTISQINACGDADYSVFFVPAEHFGSVGSGRVVVDAANFTCRKFRDANNTQRTEACLDPVYSSLNITTIDFSAYSHFIAVEQVGLASEPLRFHVDERVSGERGSANQRRVEEWLVGDGVERADTTHLPYSPITTLLDLLPDSVKQSSSFVTISRYNTAYANPYVFTANDTAEGLGVEAVEKAANVLLALAEKQLNCTSSGGTVTSVNQERVRELWKCFGSDFGCEYLRCSTDSSQVDGVSGQRVLRPNFYPGPFTELSESSAQNLIARALWSSGLEALRTPAFSPVLELGPAWYDMQWNANWEDPTSTSSSSSSSDSGSTKSRYSVYVESYWGTDTGVRLTTVSRSTTSTVTFIVSIVLNVVAAVAVVWGSMFFSRSNKH